jgi:biopolymer transport protein ExbD
MNIGPRNKIKVGGGLAAVSAVVLVMLIFFLIMTVIGKKPEETADKPEEKKFDPAVTVVITKDNQYYLLPGESDKDKRGFDDIQDEIIAKVQDSESKQLKINGAQLAKYETVYNVAGLAQKNNWEYRLDFVPEAGE